METANTLTFRRVVFTLHSNGTYFGRIGCGLDISEERPNRPEERPPRKLYLPDPRSLFHPRERWPLLHRLSRLSRETTRSCQSSPRRRFPNFRTQPHLRGPGLLCHPLYRPFPSHTNRSLPSPSKKQFPLKFGTLSHPRDPWSSPPHPDSRLLLRETIRSTRRPEAHLTILSHLR